MASFAKIGLNNKVIAVHSVHNDVLKDSNGVEQEVNGIDFLTKLYGWSIWIQTSYNKNIRKNFAGIGFIYDEIRDAFIPPKPYNSWILNETTCNWESPVAMPTTVLEENQYYSWNESTLTWNIIEV
jgi:hypothetical protein